MNNSGAKSDFMFKEGVPLKWKLFCIRLMFFYEKVIVFGQKKNYSNRSWGGKYAVCFSLFLTLSSSIKQRSLNWLWFFININLHVVYFYGKNCLP